MYSGVHAFTTSGDWRSVPCGSAKSPDRPKRKTAPLRIHRQDAASILCGKPAKGTGAAWLPPPSVIRSARYGRAGIWKGYSASSSTAASASSTSTSSRYFSSISSSVYSSASRRAIMKFGAGPM